MENTPLPSDKPALTVQSLSIDIHGQPIVTNVGFSLPAASTLALVGESGCGKSITALALMNLLPQGAQIRSGSIILGGEDVTGFSERQWLAIRGRRMGMIFQDSMSALDPLMTIGRQIGEALRLRGITGRRALREAAKEMLSHVGIPNPDERLDQFPYELSGGMCQRVMIVIALAAQAELLIADEPTTALDVTIQAQILELIDQLRREYATAVLLITHDMGVVAEVADSVAVMYAGCVVEYGSKTQVLTAPAHPYTKLLLKAIPTLTAQRGQPLDVIEGVVPEPDHWPTGCRFAPRCPSAQDVCREAMPDMQWISKDHGAACYFAHEFAG